jgi:hypothetical protein
MSKYEIPTEHLEEAGYQGNPVPPPEALKRPQLIPVAAKPQPSAPDPPAQKRPER